VNFKLVPVDDLFDKILKLKDGTGSSQTQSSLGYGSSNFLKNIGLAFLAMSLAGLVLVFAIFIVKRTKKGSLFHKVFLFIKHKLMFNMFIRSFI
jgi:hypothetical protein